MKRFLLLIFFLLLNQINLLAQAKSYFKLNVSDCVNCTSVLSKILQRDPKLTFVIKEDYVTDSIDVLDKFNLSSYSKQIIWSSKLYDSLDNIPESEYIQYCGKQEVNRSGLKNFKFVTINCTASEYCLPSLSNNILFYDYKQYVLIQNHISNQFYCYYKKNNEFKTIKVDSNFVKKLYIDYLKNVKQYEVYNYMLNTDKTIKPKIQSIVPIDDSSVFACLRTYKIEFSNKMDTNLTEMHSLIKLRSDGKAEVFYINDSMPILHHYFNPNIFISNNDLYSAVFMDEDSLLKYKLPFTNIVKFKKNSKVFKFNSVVKSNLNEYLITNKVFNNFNKTFGDNGYALMSLSNYIINLETEEKVYIPFPDTVFRNIRINPKNYDINYVVLDFKYNTLEKMFYISYLYNEKSYVASFQANSKVFYSNEILYSLDNPLSYAFKNKCLSWDGKKVLYCMKGENCFKYATVAEIQAMAKQYEKVTETK